MAERRTVWNMPPGGITTRCPDCEGSGTVYVRRQYIGSDGMIGSMSVPGACKSCRGKGRFEGMQPPI